MKIGMTRASIVCIFFRLMPAHQVGVGIWQKRYLSRLQTDTWALDTKSAGRLGWSCLAKRLNPQHLHPSPRRPVDEMESCTLKSAQRAVTFLKFYPLTTATRRQVSAKTCLFAGQNTEVGDLYRRLGINNKALQTLGPLWLTNRGNSVQNSPPTRSITRGSNSKSCCAFKYFHAPPFAEYLRMEI